MSSYKIQWSFRDIGTDPPPSKVEIKLQSSSDGVTWNDVSIETQYRPFIVYEAAIPDINLQYRLSIETIRLGRVYKEVSLPLRLSTGTEKPIRPVEESVTPRWDMLADDLIIDRVILTRVNYNTEDYTAFDANLHEDEYYKIVFGYISQGIDTNHDYVIIDNKTTISEFFANRLNGTSIGN